MGQKKSEFDKVFSAWDILVIAFGAMIGWGWVVSSGTWIDAGGVVGAALAFAIGGVMVSMYSAIRQWDLPVPLSVPGRSFLDM